MTEMYPERGPHEPPDIESIDLSITPEEELGLRRKGLIAQNIIFIARAKEGYEELSKSSTENKAEALKETIEATKEATKFREAGFWVQAMIYAGVPDEKINKFLTLKFPQRKNE